MFERRNTPLLPFGAYLVRQLKWVTVAAVIIAMSLLIGAAGYRWLEGLSWIDAFVNATMMLTGIGEEIAPSTHAGKLFSIFYALFGALVFLSVIGLMLAPAFHRLLHHFHLSNDERERDESA